MRVSEAQNTLAVEGAIQQIDLTNRAMTVREEKSMMAFDVPPACTVRLNGERVKLRMLQPRDHVSIRYGGTPNGLVAQSIEARTPFSAARY